MKLKELIQDYKEKTGMNDSEIARRTGVSRSTVTRWANGDIHRLSAEAQERLSAMLGYDIEPLLKGMETTYRLPVLGYVKAGYNLFAQENYLGEEDVTFDEKKKGDYYLKVTGNSMSGVGIMENSLVLVRQCDHIESGRIGVIMIDDEVTVKRVIYKNNMMILEAANPNIENRYFTPQEIKNLPVKIIGRVLLCKTYY